jgi:hypothetical protein
MLGTWMKASLLLCWKSLKATKPNVLSLLKFPAMSLNSGIFVAYWSFYAFLIYYLEN